MGVRRGSGGEEKEMGLRREGWSQDRGRKSGGKGLDVRRKGLRSRSGLEVRRGSGGQEEGLEVGRKG